MARTPKDSPSPAVHLSVQILRIVLTDFKLSISLKKALNVSSEMELLVSMATAKFADVLLSPGITAGAPRRVLGRAKLNRSARGLS